jgi:hypothetical protein
VQPTLQAQGVAIKDETALEHEADVMGTKAMQMRRPDRIAADAAAQTATVVPQVGETREQSEPSQAVQRQEEPDEELQAKPSIADVQRSPLPTQVQLARIIHKTAQTSCKSLIA